MTEPDGLADVERDHENAWYARAVADGFFEREGFRRLVAWNLAALRRAVPLRPSMRLVSIGCGMGEYEVALAPHVARIDAVDISETAVEQARLRAARLGVRNVTFSAMPFQELSLTAGTVDLVYALGLVHHLPHEGLRASLFEAARDWLVPGGWIYLRDPSANGLPRRLAYRFFRDRCGIHSPNESHLDPHGIRREVEAAGFTDARVDYTDLLGGPLPWLVRSPSPLFWASVFAFDRAWLAVPGLRTLASQFSVTARKPDAADQGRSR